MALPCELLEAILATVLEDAMSKWESKIGNLHLMHHKQWYEEDGIVISRKYNSQIHWNIVGRSLLVLSP